MVRSSERHVCGSLPPGMHSDSKTERPLQAGTRIQQAVQNIKTNNSDSDVGRKEGGVFHYIGTVVTSASRARKISRGTAG